MIDGFNAPNSAVYILLDDKLTTGFCNYLVAIMLHHRIIDAGFKKKTSGRLFAKLSNGHELSGLLRCSELDTDPSRVPFRIIARNKDASSRSSIIAIVDCYSYTGFKKALAFLNSLSLSDAELLDTAHPQVFM